MLSPERRIIWLIDDLLLEKHDRAGFPDIATAAREAGHEVIIKTYVPFSEEIDLSFFDEPRGCPVVAHGCVGFIKQLQRAKLNECPVAYLKEEELKFSKAAAMWGRSMLNEKFIMLPYGELSRRIKEDLYDGLRPPYYHDHKLFVRPNVVTKSFAGRVFDFESEEDDIDALDKYEKIDPSELVIIADPVEIEAEYRHIVVNGKVVAESQYRRDNVLDIRIDVDRENSDLAKWVAEKNNFYQWEPDYVYVVDTAMTVDGPRIVEFNSFSCSGLYACDTRAIVEAVSRQAWKEYEGDLD